MFFAKVSKNVLKIFSRKLVPLKMNQEPIGSRNQVEVGVNCKNKIPQNFLKPIESHQWITLIFESWIAKLISSPKVI